MAHFKKKTLKSCPKCKKIAQSAKKLPNLVTLIT